MSGDEHRITHRKNWWRIHYDQIHVLAYEIEQSSKRPQGQEVCGIWWYRLTWQQLEIWNRHLYSMLLPRQIGLCKQQTKPQIIGNPKNLMLSRLSEIGINE